MKFLRILILTSLWLMGDTTYGQPLPHDLLAVGPEGAVVQVLMPNDDGLDPIVLLGDEVLSPGSVDCALARGHPQCRALDHLLGTEMVGPGPAPLIVAVDTAGDVTLYFDAGPSTYLPPAVLVGGVWINRAEANNLQVIGPSGELVVFEAGDSDSLTPFVQLNGQALNAGGLECELVLGEWRCHLPGGGSLQWRDSESGPVVVSTGVNGGVSVDFTVSDAPPPAVYKDGDVLNR